MSVEALEPIQRLARDIKDAAIALTDTEARYLVDSYYTMQEHRIAFDNQVRSLEKLGEPNEIIQWFATQARTLENQVQRALDAYSKAHRFGDWLRSVCGIGPILAAGLLAHIDIEKAQTVGNIWRFAGLDPTVKWGKGQRRPWNASLKTLCWKIGESFVKVKGRESDVYGKVYEDRKTLEITRNIAGECSDVAAARAAELKAARKTSSEAYKWYRGAYLPNGDTAPDGTDGQPMLPPGHLHARAKRYAVKLFLAHLWEDMYEIHHGKSPPLPYPIAHLGHAHHLERKRA